jgi:hypothetical protein
MKTLSTLARKASALIPTLSLLAVAAAMSGCHSHDPDPAPPAGGIPPPPPAPPEPIEGIATPSSVAVVTATNAQ